MSARIRTMSINSYILRLTGRPARWCSGAAEGVSAMAFAVVWLVTLVAVAVWPGQARAARIDGASGYHGRVLPGAGFVEGSALERVYGLPVTVTITDFRPSLVFGPRQQRCLPTGEGFCFSVLIHTVAGELLDRIDGVAAIGQAVTGGLPDAILIADPDFAGFGMVIVLPGRPDPVTGEPGSHALDLDESPFDHADANALIIAGHLERDAGDGDGDDGDAPARSVWAGRFTANDRLGW